VALVACVVGHGTIQLESAFRGDGVVGRKGFLGVALAAVGKVLDAVLHYYDLGRIAE